MIKQIKRAIGRVIRIIRGFFSARLTHTRTHVNNWSTAAVGGGRIASTFQQ